MSITYPEAQQSAASRKASSAAIMNSGSALFPNGSTNVYERSAKTRTTKSMPLAWIAAPVAVVLIGGAVYLSTSHHSTPPSTVTHAMTTTSVTAPAAASAPAAGLTVQPVEPPAVVQTHQETRIRTTEAPVQRAAPPVAHVMRAKSVTHTNVVSGTVPAPAPVMTAPAQAVTPAAASAAPTPGTFAYTPAEPTSAPAQSVTTPDVSSASAPATTTTTTTDQSSPQT